MQTYQATKQRKFQAMNLKQEPALSKTIIKAISNYDAFYAVPIKP
jgi:hypothetical protein